MLSRFEQIEMYLLRQGHLFIPHQRRCAAYWWSQPIRLQQQHNYSGRKPNRRSAWKRRWSCDHSDVEVSKPHSYLGSSVRCNSWDHVSVVTAVEETVSYKYDGKLVEEKHLDRVVLKCTAEVRERTNTQCMSAHAHTLPSLCTTHLDA